MRAKRFSFCDRTFLNIDIQRADIIGLSQDCPRSRNRPANTPFSVMLYERSKRHHSFSGIEFWEISRESEIYPVAVSFLPDR